VLIPKEYNCVAQSEVTKTIRPSGNNMTYESRTLSYENVRAVFSDAMNLESSGYIELDPYCTITVSTTDYKTITRIKINFVNNADESVILQSGGGSFDKNTGLWSGNSTSIQFYTEWRAAESGTAQISSIEVTYKD